MVVNMHTTGDIIKQMQSAHYDNSRYAAKIAKYFKGTNITNTCSKIFNWIKDNVEYRIEPAHLQTTKSIQRLVADGYGDCKHYSGLFAAILSQLGIKHHYRFVSYTSSKIPTHVYVVAYNEKGKQIICDAVLPNFNTEKEYKNKIDKNMLMHLSGIGEIDQIGKKGKGKAFFRKVTAGAKKIGIAPARAAFLTLVALNVRGFANKLQKNNQSKLKSKWNNLGGDFGKLQQAIKNGAAKKPFLSGIDEDDSIGSVVGTALASSAPVLIALKEFIKENPQFIEKAKDAFKNKMGQPVENTPFDSEPDAGVAPQQPSKSADGMSSGNNMKYILLAGGAAALFLLTKKK
jgi:predicted nucleic acid-binding Zn finger protein